MGGYRFLTLNHRKGSIELLFFMISHFMTLDLEIVFHRKFTVPNSYTITWYYFLLLEII